jgi:hypothetical protein
VPGLGVYNGDASEDPENATLREFGDWPDVASSYYQVTQKINMAFEKTRMDHGTSPNITITTKGTQYIAGIVHNDPTATAWLDSYVSQLAQLAAYNPKVPVYATIDHEMRVKVNRGQITGESADPAVYGKALDIFYHRLEAAAPSVRTTYWIVGYDRTFEGTVGQQFTLAPDVIEFDPYANTGSDTIATITKADLSWIKSQPFYVGQSIALGEFGMPVKNGDDSLGKFYSDVRQSFATLGISWGVFFNRERDNDHKIVDRSDGQQFPKAVAAFSQSLLD